MDKEIKKESKYVEMSACLDLSEDLKAIFKQAQTSSMSSEVTVENKAIAGSNDLDSSTKKENWIRKIINGLHRNN